jgi:hypothetical protein
MSRSLSYLRRGLFSLAFVGSLGFGATQALANPEQWPYPYPSCELGWSIYIPQHGCPECTYGGYCNGTSYDCICFNGTIEG